LRKMYSIFNRKYKKNLKALYIIHPTVWVKLIFRLFKPFISNKFWRKLVYIDEGIDIFNYFPLDQISLPKYVINYGRPPKPMFGQPLEEVVRRPDNLNQLVPLLVTNAISYLNAKALHIEGIFRLSGSNAQIKELKRSFDAGEEVDLEEVEDPHVVSGILKLFLRELPVPLFPYDVYPLIIENQHKTNKAEHACTIIASLPDCNRATIKALFSFLALIVQNSQVNRMTVQNISIVMGPNLIRDPHESMQSAVNDAGAINVFVGLLVKIFSEKTGLLDKF